jgi:hypothetical protein
MTVVAAIINRREASNRLAPNGRISLTKLVTQIGVLLLSLGLWAAIVSVLVSSILWALVG